MKILFKKENLKTTILALIYLLMGVSFLVVPVGMFNFVETALCVILLIAGVAFIMFYSLMSVEDRNFKNLIHGIVLLALAVCMMIVPRFFGIILSLIIGYSGVSLIISGLKEKKKGEKLWITEFVIGLVVTVLSIVAMILSGTNSAKKIISIFFGIILLINAIYSLTQLVVLVVKSREKKQSLLIEPVAEEAKSDVSSQENKIETKITEEKQVDENKEIEEKQETEAKESVKEEKKSKKNKKEKLTER